MRIKDYLMRYSILLSLIILNACQLGPKYCIPDVPVPEGWKEPSGKVCSPLTCADLENWWNIFEDEYLNDLEVQVIEHNPDLYVALQRVAEARALAGVFKGDLYPQIHLNPAYSNINELIQLYGV